jgi:hydrogenase maturation protease
MKSAGPDTEECMAARILILAYGNPLRSDDGVAWHAAQLLRERGSTARIVSAHQLAPEFAAMAAEADGVVFLDATRNGEPGQIFCERVDPKAVSSPGSHWLTPAQLMALCRQLYGVTPRAMAISIVGECFDHGDTLSKALAGALPNLIELTGDVIGSFSSPERQACSRRESPV